jgi:hypothetical protein
MPDFDPDRILSVLARHKVRFVVIGGFGAVLHGSPFATADVDITPDSTADNMQRLSEALTELGARVRTDAVPGGLPFSHDGTSLAAARVWNLTTDAGDLDISMEPAGTQGFPDLERDATVVVVHRVRTRVASLADIIRSKQAANRPKDQRVLPTLREILATRDQR